MEEEENDEEDGEDDETDDECRDERRGIIRLLARILVSGRHIRRRAKVAGAVRGDDGDDGGVRDVWRVCERGEQSRYTLARVLSCFLWRI